MTGNEMTVKMGETVVAHNEERFIPRGNAIYAYSRNGGTFDWIIPENFRGKQLKAFTLSRDGKAPFSHFTLKGSTISLALDATSPVQIVLAETDRK
jgi:hypothetical protein